MQTTLLNVKWPEVDMTVTISVIVALCALISPWVTALINNHHATQIRKLELQEKRYEEVLLYKRTVFEEYIQALENAMNSDKYEVYSTYGRCYSRAVLSVSEVTASMMNEMDNSIKMAYNGEFANQEPFDPPYKADPTMRSQFTAIRRQLQIELQAECERCTPKQHK